MTPRLSFLLLATLLWSCPACMSLDYDLSGVAVPISAKPADPALGDVEPFTIEAPHVLWVHGLLGRRQPDVAALVAARARGHDGITGFRVTQRSGVSHWLLTHLSLTLVRTKTVVIEGQLVGDAGPPEDGGASAGRSPRGR